MKKCNGMHCRCMQTNCPNVHYADCVEHNPSLSKIKTKCDHKGRILTDFNEETFEAKFYCKKCNSLYIRKPKFVCQEVEEIKL